MSTNAFAAEVEREKTVMTAAPSATERDAAAPSARKPAAGQTFSCTAEKKFALGPDALAALERNFTQWGYLQHPYHRRRHWPGWHAFPLTAWHYRGITCQ